MHTIELYGSISVQLGKNTDQAVERFNQINSNMTAERICEDLIEFSGSSIVYDQEEYLRALEPFNGLVTGPQLITLVYDGIESPHYIGHERYERATLSHHQLGIAVKALDGMTAHDLSMLACEVKKRID